MNTGNVVVQISEYLPEPPYWVELNLMVPSHAPAAFLPNDTNFDGGQTQENHHSALRFSVGGMEANLRFSYTIPRVIATESLSDAIVAHLYPKLVLLEALVSAAVVKTIRNKGAPTYLSGLSVQVRPEDHTVYGLDSQLKVAVDTSGERPKWLRDLCSHIITEQGRYGIRAAGLGSAVEQMLVVLHHIDELSGIKPS